MWEGGREGTLKQITVRARRRAGELEKLSMERQEGGMREDLMKRGRGD